MTDKMTRSEQLDQLLTLIKNSTGDASYSIEQAYGQPRLVRANESVSVSPRLPHGQMVAYMRAFLDGVDAGNGDLQRLRYDIAALDAAKAERGADEAELAAKAARSRMPSYDAR